MHKNYRDVYQAMEELSQVTLPQHILGHNPFKSSHTIGDPYEQDVFVFS